MSTPVSLEEIVDTTPYRTRGRMPVPFPVHHGPSSTFFAPDPLSLIGLAFLLPLAQMRLRTTNPYLLPKPHSSTLPPLPRLKSGLLTRFNLTCSTMPRWPWRRGFGRSKRKLKKLGLTVLFFCPFRPLIGGKELSTMGTMWCVLVFCARSLDTQSLLLNALTGTGTRT